MNEHSLNIEQRKFLELVLKSSLMDKLELVDYRDAFDEKILILEGNCWEMKDVKESIKEALSDNGYDDASREQFRVIVMYWKNRKDIELFNK